jgi:hypothetical protein
LALLVSACTSAMTGEYAGSSGKTLLLTRETWNSYQDYVSNISSTNSGAFVVAARDGVGLAYTDAYCPTTRCVVGKGVTNMAMEDCRHRGRLPADAAVSAQSPIPTCAGWAATRPSQRPIAG